MTETWQARRPPAAASRTEQRHRQAQATGPARRRPRLPRSASSALRMRVSRRQQMLEKEMGKLPQPAPLTATRLYLCPSRVSPLRRKAQGRRWTRAASRNRALSPTMISRRLRAQPARPKGRSPLACMECALQVGCIRQGLCGTLCLSADTSMRSAISNLDSAGRKSGQSLRPPTQTGALQAR